jgi:hypothetical protein
VDMARLLGVPTANIAVWDLPSWTAGDCALCEAGQQLKPAIDLN